MKPLLLPQELDLARRLQLHPRRRVAGQATGEQRSPALGGGIEFADYREYVPGDDVRQVDWSVFLRFRKLLVKLAAEEKELTLWLAVDTSASMDYGASPKLWQACRVAALLGSIALQSGNRAGVLSWSSGLKEVTAPLRGARAASTLVERLQRLEARDEGDPRECARQLAARYRRSLVVVLTDLLTPHWETVLGGLNASGSEVHLVHVLSPEELDPPQRGELTLVDQENGDQQSLLVDAPLLERYRNETTAWLNSVESQAQRWGLSYARVSSDQALTRVFLDTLRQEGLVC